LHPNRTDAESTTFGALIDLLPNGFRPAASSNQINQSGDVYVYVAIRRPTAVPESATDVFAIDQWASGSPSFDSPFPVDFGFIRSTAGSAWNSGARLLGIKTLNIDNSIAEFDSSDLMWKRAPKYFDVVAYTGDGTTDGSKSIQHNLKVAPELMIIKRRTGTTSNWAVYSQTTGATNSLELNSTAAAAGSSSFGSTSPTSSEFYVAYNSTNKSAESHIAYLFASLAGVSKVGSYTGNGTNQTINCGFSAGARFILIKRTDSTGDWYIWDTERGIVAANDPHLSLNSTAAQVTTDDSIDPDNSGFIVNQVSATNINVSSATYIFYAIA
jgi:hypothetical protein